MATLQTTVIHGNIQALYYQDPFLITHNRFSNTLTVWKSHLERDSVTLEGLIHNPFEDGCTIHADRAIICSSIILTEPPSPSHRTGNILVSIYSLTNGALLDSMPLASFSSSQNGHAYFMGSHEDMFAIWINDDGENGLIHVYSLTNEGKIHHLGMLYPPVLQTSITATGISRLNMPRAITPTQPHMLHLASDHFIGVLPSSFDDPTVHIVRWSSEKLYLPISHTNSLVHAEFPARRELMNSDVRYLYSLHAHVYIPSKNEIIIAHYEQPEDMMDYAPITILRCIDCRTFMVKWSTNLCQRLQQLRYVSFLNGHLVAIGQTWDAKEHDRIEDEGRAEFRTFYGIIVLDALTGSIRRTEYVGPPSNPCGPMAEHRMCDVSPSRADVVVAYPDGQLVICPLPEFLERGFHRQESVSLEDPLKAASTPLITQQCSVGEAFSGSNSRQRSKIKKHKEKGTWTWAKDALVGDGKVIFLPSREGGFVVVNWT